MPRDAAHGEGIQVMDLAKHEPAAHRATLGGRDVATMQPGCGRACQQIHETQVGKSQRLPKQALGQDIQARGHGLLDQCAEQNEAQIRINRLAARLVG